MTPQQLKNSILQRAIEGRLVEQRPEEGTAKELLKEIQAEKARLVKEGKIKKSKALPPITEEEKPFDIPDGWEWVRLGDIGLTNIGLTYKPTDITTKNGIIVLRSSNIQNDKLTYDDIVRVKTDIPENKMCSIGDILICARNGSKRLVGKAAIIEKDGMSFGAFMAIFKPLILDSRYILHVINSAYFRNSLLKDTGTTTINQITQNMLKEFVLPLPPLSEQRRIVAKLEEILPLIDKYDKAYTKLTDFNTRFPEAMKKSLLQYAIQGKLVEQHADEGTAHDLIKDIQAEKKRLIDEKKIKKPKALPPITEEEIPFDIPENWEWVRLDDIAANNDNAFADGPFGSNLKREHYTEKHEVRIIQLSNIGDMGWRNSNEKYTTCKHLETISRSEVAVGDIVIAKMMPAGRAIEVPDLGTKFVLSSDAVKFVPHKVLYKPYLLYAINSSMFREQINAEVHGITRVRTSLTKLKKYLIPLPPLNEQQRIVAKLKELLPFCDQLSSKQN